jgi:hypothetical protein
LNSTILPENLPCSKAVKNQPDSQIITKIKSSSQDNFIISAKSIFIPEHIERGDGFTYESV